MEAIAAEPRCLVPPRDRDDLHDAEQIMMKSRLSKHATWGNSALRRRNASDRVDLAGQVVGVIRNNLAQLVEDFARDALRTKEAITSVDDAMTDEGDVLLDRRRIQVAG